MLKFENKFPYSEVKKKIIGGELIKTVLDSISLKEMIKEMREKLERRNLFSFPSGVKADKSLLKRIRIYESFLSSETHPNWMILTTIAVLPPNLRPLVELEGGLLVAADVNEIYRLIIIRNQRLFDFLYTFVAVELVIAQSKKLLQVLQLFHSLASDLLLTEFSRFRVIQVGTIRSHQAQQEPVGI